MKMRLMQWISLQYENSIRYFGIICALCKDVSTQNEFMYKNMYTHKWVCVCTYEYTYMLRKVNRQFLIHVTMYFLIFFNTRRHVYFYLVRA